MWQNEISDIGQKSSARLNVPYTLGNKVTWQVITCLRKIYNVNINKTDRPVLPRMV